MASIPIADAQPAFLYSYALLEETYYSLFTIRFFFHPHHLNHTLAWLAMVAWWSYSCEQRSRDHALHGMGDAFTHYPDTKEIPSHPGLRTTHKLILSFGGYARRQQLSAYTAHACVAITIAVHPRHDSDVCLRPLCLADDHRHLFTVYYSLFTRKTHCSFATLALSCRLPAYYRHLPWSCLG